MEERVSEHTFDFQTVRRLTAVRAEPRENAEQVTQVVAGEPLRVVEVGDGWARVETAYAYPGWIEADALGGDPDPAWADPHVADPLTHARTLLGAPYLWGGMTPAGIDCSGLVHMSFRAAGKLVPRDADQQEEAGEPLAEGELRPGDLISYGDAERADHVAFWVGDRRILHSTQREGADGVLEEEEPEYLRLRRRGCFRL
jgi:cell wall-associated NlpC family hydrolase